MAKKEDVKKGVPLILALPKEAKAPTTQSTDLKKSIRLYIEVK